MHLGNGAITPECGLAALGAAALGVGVGVAAARAIGLDRARVRTAGVLGAVVFAAQMFNVPILPHSSAHWIGGALLAWALGPALGLVSMTVILTLQALLLGDGGLLALGVNVINMGFAPAAAVALVNRSGLGDSRHSAVAMGFAAFLATLAGAGLIAIEVAVGRPAAELAGWSDFAGRMLAAHAAAGLLEGLATIGLITLLSAVREPHAAGVVLSAPKLSALAALALALVGLPALGFASALPDGYQAALAAAGNSGFAIGEVDGGVGLSGIGAIAQSWQDATTSALPLPPALVAALGALAAGCGVGICALGAARGPSERAGSARAPAEEV